MFDKRMLILILVYVVFTLVWLLAFHFIFDVPYRRKKAQQAALKASSVQREGVWPPAPTTHSEEPVAEYWVWCALCHRTSLLEDIAANEGRCCYVGCPGIVTDLVSWSTMVTKLPEMPKQPEPGRTYSYEMP